MHMHTNVIIHTDKAFVSMHNEACNLQELLVCVYVCVCIYYCDISLHSAYGDFNQIVDCSLNVILGASIMFLSQFLVISDEVLPHCSDPTLPCHCFVSYKGQTATGKLILCSVKAAPT